MSVTAWVFGHQCYEIVSLLLHPLFFFAWMYVLTLTPVPAWSYYITLVVVGFYTSGLGYLVRGGRAATSQRRAGVWPQVTLICTGTPC